MGYRVEIAYMSAGPDQDESKCAAIYAAHKAHAVAGCSGLPILGLGWVVMR